MWMWLAGGKDEWMFRREVAKLRGLRRLRSTVSIAGREWREGGTGKAYWFERKRLRWGAGRLEVYVVIAGGWIVVWLVRLYLWR